MTSIHAFCSKDFNHCKWAKAIVAVAALPMIALIGASLFDPLLLRIVGAFVAILVTLFIARWIDAIPLLQAKIRKVRVTE